MAKKLKSVNELYEHKGDIIQIDEYSSIWNRIKRKKITGTFILMGDEERWKNYKTIPMSVYDNYGNGPKFLIYIVKEGHSLEEVVKERQKEARGPLEKKATKEECKNLVPLEKITIVECYHK